jgi:hypothetical protein
VSNTRFVPFGVRLTSWCAKPLQTTNAPTRIRTWGLLLRRACQRSRRRTTLPPRVDSPYLIPARRGGVFAVNNFRRREWAPAIEASGVRRPARIYDLRSTFASNALAAGVTVFELARVMGTSVAMIERSYGTLIEGAGADIARRLGAFEAAQDDDNRQQERR